MGSGADASGLLAQGERLLATLFNQPDAAIAEAVSAYAGIKAESAGTVLRLVGAVLPALLGQYTETYHLRPEALGVALLGLRNTVRGMVPRGLTGLTELLWPEGMGTGATCGSLQPGAGAAEASHLRWYQTLLASTSFVVLLTLTLV
ncbi:hypothetical protein BEN48_06765 [Hymenobacter glacialis]|uniref:Uncharacterized protein n=2 Tax=Hymenobacter glacialis TaxID=1908236 RepID=A0A1G1SRN5_9BACT|nr:hypothetical protein BEN48_06765 [Hymenobacter glacialis]